MIVIITLHPLAFFHFLPIWFVCNDIPWPLWSIAVTVVFEAFTSYLVRPNVLLCAFYIGIFVWFIAFFSWNLFYFPWRCWLFCYTQIVVLFYSRLQHILILYYCIWLPYPKALVASYHDYCHSFHHAICFLLQNCINTSWSHYRFSRNVRLHW